MRHQEPYALSEGMNPTTALTVRVTVGEKREFGRVKLSEGERSYHGGVDWLIALGTFRVWIYR